LSEYGPSAESFEMRIEKGVTGISIWLSVFRVDGSMMPKFEIVFAGQSEKSSTVTPIMRTAQQSCRGVNTIEESIGRECVATQKGFASPALEW
jgi:hypothetical protein